MMKVNQRKLFNNRPARSKLNQMGGIMASSPELMQTVQGFQRGGSIYANQPSMIDSIMDFLSTGDAGSGVGQIQEQNAMIRAGITPDDLQRVQAQVTPEDLRRVEAATTANRAADAVEAARARPVPTGDLSAAVQNIQGQLSDIGALMTPAQRAASEARMNVLNEAQSGRLAEDIFGQGYGMPQDQAAFMMPGVTPSPEQEPAVVQEAPQTEAELAADSRDNRAIVEAAKKGELGAAEQVKAVVQQGTPEEREQSLTDLMNEFKQNAPEYKGMDRGLAIAKIGFAMAAGQDPRAIVNISKALSDGADMMIKDEKERSAFQRQLDLSALQYGLGEVGKRRAQDRLDKRTFREYVADEGFTWKGKKYESGDSVLISQSDILRNGGQIPDGLQDKAVYAAGIKAASEKAKAFNDAVTGLKEEAVLEDSAATKISEQYGTAVNNFQSAEVGVQLLENAILDVAEGEVTGFANGFGSAMNKLANAAGIQLDQKFESVDQFKATLRRAFQKLIPTTLGEAQSANSISNRDVEFLADAYINAGALQNGVFSLAFVDEDVLIGQLQGAIGEFRKSQRGALNQMTTLEGRLYGRTMPGTRAPATELVAPFRQSMSPYMPGQTGTQSGLVKGDDGVFRFQ